MRYYLIRNVVYMRAALGRPDTVHERDLKVTVNGGVGNDHAPAIVGVRDSRCAHKLGGVDSKVLALDERAVPVHLDVLTDRHREICRPATEETLHSRADRLETEPRQIRSPGDRDVGFHL